MAAESDERDINLGPFFSLGVLLVVFGLRRRKKLAVVAGLGSIWVDQRSSFGRSLTERIKNRGVQMAEAQAERASAATPVGN